MRLITYTAGGRTGPGLVVGDGVVDLARRLGVGSLRALMAEGLLGEVARLKARPDARLADVRLELPVPDPGKILCVGVNYTNRNEEYRDGSQPPAFPSLFMRTPQSLVPHGEPVLVPHESAQLDYEGEIVLVIGRAGRRIAEAEADGHIAGLTIMNEGSVRDWIRHGKFNVTQGKNFDRSGGLGPWIEADLAGLPLDDLAIETRVNGAVRQKDTTASLAFPFRRLIAYVSAFTTLQPGDLIATGTPTGSGGRLDPPAWLKAGDLVEVTVQGVGTLANPVAAE